MLEVFNIVHFLLTKSRQRMTAQLFLIKAICNNCNPRVRRVYLSKLVAFQTLGFVVESK